MPIDTNWFCTESVESVKLVRMPGLGAWDVCGRCEKCEMLGRCVHTAVLGLSGSRSQDTPTCTTTSESHSQAIRVAWLFVGPLPLQRLNPLQTPTPWGSQSLGLETPSPCSVWFWFRLSGPTRSSFSERSRPMLPSFLQAQMVPVVIFLDNPNPGPTSSRCRPRTPQCQTARSPSRRQSTCGSVNDARVCGQSVDARVRTKCGQAGETVTRAAIITASGYLRARAYRARARPQQEGKQTQRGSR